MAMESKILTITPNMAKVMLEQNIKNNRRLNHNAVNRYARIMKAGGWNLTHQGIAFDDQGQLIDGQHRLEAIVRANVPVTMMATYGVKHNDGEAFTIDTGTKRTTKNIIQISGIEDDVYKIMATYAASYMRLKGTFYQQPEAAEIIGYIDRHYDEMSELYDIFGKSVQAGGKSGIRLHTIMGVALIAAFYHGEPEDALRSFVDVYCHNEVGGVNQYNVRHALNIREYVRSHKPSPETLQRAECAVYSFVHNQTQMRICDRYPFRPALDA